MPSKVSISYYLPSLGQIDCQLHAESASIYRALADRGEIDRLKSVPQLGAVVSVWEGTRHTKWEYIVLLLFLIQECKEFVDFQLNSKIKVSSSLTISSTQELLNCWAILLQTGHLFWTFTSERILLEEVHKQTGLIRELLLFIEDKEANNWASEVIKKGDHYQFNKVLSYYRIFRLITDASTYGLATQAISSYVLPPKNLALEKAKRLFNRLKRLAFLTLDIENSPAIASLRIDRILRERRTLARILMSSQATEDELAGIERFLVQNVYLNEDVLLNVARSENALKKRIRSGFSNNNLRYVVGELAKTSFINSSKEDDLVVMNRFVMTVPSMLDSYFPTLFNAIQQKNRAYKWAERHQVYLKLSYEVDAGRRSIVFQIHAKRENYLHNTAAISYAFRFIDFIFSDLNKRLSIGNYALLQQFIDVDECLESIMTSALKHIFQRNLRWEWDTRLNEKKVAISSRTNIDTMMAAFQNRPRQDYSGSRQQNHEREATLRSVNGLYAGPTIFSTTGIQGFDEDGKVPIVEFDGVIITRDRKRNQLIVTLVEAKSQRKRAEKTAREALRDKTRRVKITDNAVVGRIHSRTTARRAWAWRHIRLSYSAQ